MTQNPIRLLLPFIALAGIIFSQCTPAFARSEASRGATVVVSTNRTDRYGVQIMLDGGTIPLKDVPEFFSKLHASAPSGDASVQVIVVVPKNAPQHYRDQFLLEIRQTIDARYPNAQYEIHESFVDLNADALTLLEKRAEVEKMKAQPGLTEAQQDLLVYAEEQIEVGLKEDQRLCESWFQSSCSKFFAYFNPALKALNHPYNSVVAAHAVAMTKFGISSVVTLSKYGINPTSVMIATLQGGITAAFGFNAKSWSQWCTSHEFPFLKETAAVQWYNRNGWFKSANVNFLRSMGLNYVMRMLAYWTGQETGGRPVETANSAEFMMGAMGIALPEVYLDGLMDDGLRALELKGRLTDQNRRYLLWGISFIDTAMHTLFRTGNVNAAYAVATAGWTLKSAVWAAGKYAPAKENRIVFISDFVGTKPEKAPPKVTENRLQFITNFLWYLTGVGGVSSELLNRINGTFMVSDDQLVRRDLGITELVTAGGLSLENLARIKSDPNLSKKDLSEILNLKDADPKIVEAILEYRNRLLKDAQTVDPISLCAHALR